MRGRGVQVLDADKRGLLDFEALRGGLRRLQVSPTIALAPDDFESLTEVLARSDTHSTAPFASQRAHLQQRVRPNTECGALNVVEAVDLVKIECYLSHNLNRCSMVTLFVHGIRTKTVKFLNI